MEDKLSFYSFTVGMLSSAEVNCLSVQLIRELTFGIYTVYIICSDIRYCIFT